MTRRFDSNLLMVGALAPALLESMIMVPGTRKDSIEGEEGKANDLCANKLVGGNFSTGFFYTPGQIRGSLMADAKRWGSWVARRC